MSEQLSATQRYRRSIHYRNASVYYEDDNGPGFVLTMYFFHTKDWNDGDVIAEVERRHPTWRNIRLGLQSTWSPARDAPLPKRDPDLETIIANGDD